LKVAQASGVKHFVLLSAICVQKPLLTFQHAKLAFEDALVKSGMRYAIVRPTAFSNRCAAKLNGFAKASLFCVWQWPIDGLQTHQRPRFGQLLGAVRDRPCVAQPNFAHWRARSCHHSPCSKANTCFHC
jgi:hypothetical protein